MYYSTKSSLPKLTVLSNVLNNAQSIIHYRSLLYSARMQLPHGCIVQEQEVLHCQSIGWLLTLITKELKVSDQIRKKELNRNDVATSLFCHWSPKTKESSLNRNSSNNQLIDSLICFTKRSLYGPGGDSGGMAETREAVVSASKIFHALPCDCMLLPNFLDGRDSEATALDELVLMIEDENLSLATDAGADAITELKTPDPRKPCIIACSRRGYNGGLQKKKPHIQDESRLINKQDETSNFA